MSKSIIDIHILKRRQRDLFPSPAGEGLGVRALAL